jgi:hypothetical protein
VKRNEMGIGALSNPSEVEVEVVDSRRYLALLVIRIAYSRDDLGPI